MSGFTKHEQVTLVILLIGFSIGSAVWLYKEKIGPLPVTRHVIHYMSPKTEFTNQKKSDPVHRLTININRASESELIQLPGIGPVMAKRIIEYRRVSGPFKTQEALKEIKGIGNKTFETIKPFITIEMKEDS